jgi:hypothetical protein
LPLQQPSGQELALQTHAPVVVLHAWFVPHAAQVAPPVPHEPFDSAANASHVPVVPPTQQPFGHVVPSQEHAPALVSHRPFAQDVHEAPPFPHSEGDSDAYGTHTAPLQQPFAHEVELHVHRPVAVSQAWPVAQDAQAIPPVPHELFDSEA